VGLRGDKVGKFEGVSLSVWFDSLVRDADRKNWVAVHGNKKEVEADVCEAKKVTEIQRKNTFQALYRGNNGGEKEGEVVFGKG